MEWNEKKTRKKKQQTHITSSQASILSVWIFCQFQANFTFLLENLVRFMLYFCSSVFNLYSSFSLNLCITRGSRLFAMIYKQIQRNVFTTTLSKELQFRVIFISYCSFDLRSLQSTHCNTLSICFECNDTYTQNVG